MMQHLPSKYSQRDGRTKFPYIAYTWSSLRLVLLDVNQLMLPIPGANIPGCTGLELQLICCVILTSVTLQYANRDEVYCKG